MNDRIQRGGLTVAAVLDEAGQRAPPVHLHVGGLEGIEHEPRIGAGRPAREQHVRSLPGR